MGKVKQRLRGVISALMTLVLVVGLMPLPAFAAQTDGDATGSLAPAKVDFMQAASYEDTVNAFFYKNGDLVFQRGLPDDYDQVPSVINNTVWDVENHASGEYGLVDRWGGGFDVKKVIFKDSVKPKTLAKWFYDFQNLETIEGIDKLDTSAATSMSYMFGNCGKLQSIDLSSFNTANITAMDGMFSGCKSITSLDLSSFNTANVTDMYQMFSGCESVTSINISGFDTSNVTDMASMFSRCYRLTDLRFDTSKFDTSNVTTMDGMFSGCASLTSLDVTGFNTSRVWFMGDMFSGCSSLTSLDVTHFNTANVTDMSGMFGNRNPYSVESIYVGGCLGLTSLDVSNFNTSRVKSMNGMFAGCGDLQNIDVSNFDTSRVLSMKDMFKDCTALISVNVSHFNTSNVSNMQGMFEGCRNLAALTISNFDTAKVQNMGKMFSGCSSLEELDVSNMDTSNVEFFESMFAGCVSLRSIDVSNFNTEKAILMDRMFVECNSLEALDLHAFNTSSVKSMSSLVERCASLASIDISGFDTSSLTMGHYSVSPDVYQTYAACYMFSSCPNLSSIKFGSGFDLSKVTIVDGASSSAASLSHTMGLADPPTNDSYTGKWELAGGGTVATAAEVEALEGSALAGTWTWQRAGQTQAIDITGATVTLSQTSYVSDGSVKHPSVTSVTLPGGASVPSSGYTVSYQSGCVEPGTYTVTVTGTGDYTGTATATFTVTKAKTSITGATVTLSQTTYEADGNVKHPSVTRVTTMNGLTVPVSGYRVSYQSGCIEPGIYTVTVTGTGDYTGTATATFTITKAKTSIAGATVTLSQTSYVGDGSVKHPSVTSVTLPGGTVVPSSGYTVSYQSGCVEPGTYTVTVTGTGDYTGTATATFEITQPAQQNDFEWGRDNWNFINSSNTGDFRRTTYGDQINSRYSEILKNNLTSSEYQAVFKGYYYRGSFQEAWLDEAWNGSCYGMSSTALLARAGLLPYGRYKSGATALNQLPRPTSSESVESLITYYQMLQVKNVIQQQYSTVKYRPHSTNIQAIEQALESNPLVLVGYRQNGWGGHAVLAYGSEKGSWTENGRTYDSRILICDPNASKARNDQFDIYYNSSTYEWTIPRYEKNSGLSSSNGAVFNYVGADISDINAGGYLNGAASSNSSNDSGSYVARIDAHNASSGDLSVTKVEAHDGAYVEMATSAGDIVEDYSYMPSGESEGLYGFDLRDADASYLVEKNTASDDVSLVMHYEDALMNASIDGEGSVVFDRAGSVTVQGEGAYSVSMAHDGETPTDWFAMSVSGQSDGTASVSMTSDGYVIDSEDMQNVTVVGNDKDEEVRLSFSTTKDQALVHEINEDTADEALAVSIDSDGNGSFDKVIATSKGNPGCSFEVFAGAERFSTARIMVDAELELGSYSGVVVVGGQKELNKKGGETKYPDALSAAGLAGALGYPLVMVNGAGLTGQNKQALKAVMDSNGGKKLDILVIGGEYAVSKGVESQLAAYGKVSSRIAGTTRYDTNRAVYQYGKQRGLWNTSAMFVATGQNFPDALAIAPYLAWKGAPIVLTDPDRPQRLAEAAGILADAGEIIALGDVQVVPSSQLEALGMSYAERLSGTNRYQTGAAIVAWELEQGMSLEGAGFATGANFPDALASSFLLGRTGSVLCLVSPKGSQNSALQSALAGHDAPAYVRVFGGEYAVSQSRYSDIAGWLGCAGFNANPRK